MAKKKSAEPTPVPEEVTSLGMLEGDILKILWDAGEPQSSVQVYEAMYFMRRDQKQEMQSPSTIAVTLSRMVEKGLLTVERQPRGGKGYYKPIFSREQIVARILDDVCRRLTGQPLGYLLTRLNPASAGAQNQDGLTLKGLDELLQTLGKMEQEHSQ
ncbi:MAG TPA: BlaI/MecI/CopY family transcriptional regulator [Chthonomonadaceae bacterium]|nr:BlaI/MecI/CopY family transcriptional regulator [Chthonomonadaceae bacterium]